MGSFSGVCEYLKSNKRRVRTSMSSTPSHFSLSHIWTEREQWEVRDTQSCFNVSDCSMRTKSEKEEQKVWKRIDSQVETKRETGACCGDFILIKIDFFPSINPSGLHQLNSSSEKYRMLQLNFLSYIFPFLLISSLFSCALSFCTDLHMKKIWQGLGMRTKQARFVPRRGQGNPGNLDEFNKNRAQNRDAVDGHKKREAENGWVAKAPPIIPLHFSWTFFEEKKNDSPWFLLLISALPLCLRLRFHLLSLCPSFFSSFNPLVPNHWWTEKHSYANTISKKRNVGLFYLNTGFYLYYILS